MKNIYLQKNKRGPARIAKRGGFTLVETLVAISIFTLSVLALMVTLGTGLQDSNFAKRKITASYLAQEGIEYVRNIRDTYVLYPPSTGWTDFQTKFSQCFGVECYFDDQNLDYTDPNAPIRSIPVDPCGSSGCPELKYRKLTGKYNYDSSGLPGTDWENSGFTRSVSVKPIDIGGENKEMLVLSRVTWMEGSGIQQILLSENLFNWTKH